MSSEKLAIAIDIGTTYCTVGIYKNGAVEIIANEQGNRTTPAYVAFTAKETLVGESALAQAHLNTKNTIYDAKRLLGKQFSDPSIADDLKHFPFKVTADEHDRPLIHVQVKGQAITKTPEEITGILIQTMKTTAEGYLGREFPQGVLTVPASFDQKQRDATIASAKLAGFTSVILINEPTAAAMAHGLDVKTETPQHILVFDLGGGTLDVTLLHVQDGLFTVKAEVVNPRLGGENFDDKIVQHFIGDFKRKHKVDLSTSERAMRRLHNAAEKCKVVLSTASQTNMELDSIMDGNSIFEPLSRARFELLCAEYFRALPVHIQQVLTQGGIEKSDVNHVLLVGGSSRIPKVSDVVKQFFNGKAPLQKGINPDEAIAYGATRQAALIANRPKGLEDKIISRDATSLTIGFLSPSGIITPLIAKSTPLPTSATHVFTNSKSNDSKLELALYEGERPSPSDCHLLADLTIDGVKSPAQVSVTVNVAKDGTLSITAKDKSQKKEHQLTVSDSAPRFSAAEVSSHLATVSTHAAADATLRAAAQAADQLAAFIHYITTQTSTDKKIKAADKERINTNIKDIQTWLDKVATTTSRPALSEYESRFTQLHTLVTSIIESASTSSPIPSSSSPATNGIHYGDPDDIPIEHLDMNGDDDDANVEIADLD